MAQVTINKERAIEKWSPVLKSLGVSENRLEWLCEYAEYHNLHNHSKLFENAYLNASNVAGMGAVVSPQPSIYPGQTLGGGTPGSGDIGQNLLPTAIKIAAQTIGLDLVAVKPVAGPKVDLVYLDFPYDDTNLGDADERPQVFKLNISNPALLQSVRNYILTVAETPPTNGGLGQPMQLSIGGLQNGRYFFAINTAGAVNLGTQSPTYASLTEPTNKEGVVEFLGFSRIDGFPMFRAFRQWNTAHTAIGGANTTWEFDQTRNTFNPTQPMTSQINFIGYTGSDPGPVPGVALQSGNGPLFTIELVSALEDHIPGFSTNWMQAGNGFVGNYPMNREMSDRYYASVIGVKPSTKTVQIGVTEVSSGLRRSEIEDIKANTGIDIVQKMESVLANELSQTISRQIVDKLFKLGEMNRQSVMVSGASPYDLDLAYVSSVGGETTHAIQRRLITKILSASNFILADGRVGPATFIVTNSRLAAVLQDISGYTLVPTPHKFDAKRQLYPVGSIAGMDLYVDPYMRPDDHRILIGRKNEPDQPGVVFLAYLMAESITLMSEATFAPRILLRSRYAITEVGWFPQKQYMTIHIMNSNSNGPSITTLLG